MCKIGDLIVVYNPEVRHKPIGKHTFNDHKYIQKPT